MERTTSARRTTRVQPSSGWVGVRSQELWDYRELFYFLTWRDIKVRYKQTALGATWAVLQPVLTMVVFSVFFGRLAGVPSEGLPYPLFAFAALVPWTFFASAVTLAGNSLVEQERILAKVYFPRLIVPSAAVLASLVDFAIAFVVLLGLMAVYGIVPTAAILALPLLVVLAAATALAVGLWLSALNVLYRDVRYVIPFVVQLWLFISPVAYPSSLVPEPWDAIYGINPMAGVIDGFRWALLGGEAPGTMLVVSVLVTAALLVGGLLYFRRMERSFADVV
ncbi:MAG: ABC transporter permease [Chloroflexota bacterium]|nr:ABC transporter permease [Chloroflexota bacterium]